MYPCDMAVVSVLMDVSKQKALLISVWGFSLLCTALISICSLTGVFVVPCIRGDAYKKGLIFMVGLAVGTLAGSSLLFLIPEVDFVSVLLFC